MKQPCGIFSSNPRFLKVMQRLQAPINAKNTELWERHCAN